MTRFLRDLAYWIGAVQADGSFKKYKNDVRISFGISKKSLPMLRKVKQITTEFFERKCTIWKGKHLYYSNICVKSLIEVFNCLDIKFGDPPKPPNWCFVDPSFFCAYLAGLIDGDGSIWLTKNKYWKGLTCRVKICCSSEPQDLAEAIKNMLKCNVRIINVKSEGYLNGRYIQGNGVNIEFLISSKNLELAKQFIISELTIPHKINRLKTYIEYTNGHRDVTVA